MALRTPSAPEEDRLKKRAGERQRNINRLRQGEGVRTNAVGASHARGAPSRTRTSTTGAVQSQTGARSGGAVSGTSSTPSAGGSFRYNPKGDTPTAAELKDGEEGGGGGDSDQIGSGYNYSNSNSNSTGKRRFKLTRKKAIGGGAVGGIIAIVFGISSIGQGPLEFVHIAQLMDRFHFSSQEDAQDSRLMKIARYIRDPSKPQNTRMGIVGNAAADHLESRMHDGTGLTPIYDSDTGQFKGYRIDRKHDLWKNYNTDEVVNILQGYREVNGGQGQISVNGNDVIFNPEIGGVRHTVTDYRRQVRFSRVLLKNAGLSKVSTYAGARILSTRAGWTFHPIKKLDSQVQSAAIKAGKSAIDKLKEQFAKDTVNEIANGITPEEVAIQNDSAKNPDGTPVNPNDNSGADTVTNSTAEVPGDAQQTSSDLNNGNDTTDAFKGKLGKIAGGASGAVGLVCLAQGLHGKIEVAKFDKAILPMMRMASRAISLGSQAQSGQDISSLQLGFDKDLLDAKDPQTGKVTSTWNQAESIQAELGHPNTGTDIPQSGQVFGGNPLDFVTAFGPLNTVCHILSGPLGIVVGVLTGPVSAVVQFASGPAQDKLLSVLAGWLTGAPVNPLAKGADRGNFINYGARLSANDQYAAFGGVQLTPNEESVLKGTTAALDREEFDSHGLAYRLFNTKDDRTLASQLMDNYGGRSVSQNLASLTGSLGHSLASIFRAPAVLFSGMSHASAATNYDYHGLKKVGFTAEELSDTEFENPFDNACYVVGNCKLSNGTTISTSQSVLGDPNSPNQDLIDRAEKCFGTKISFDGQVWNTDSKTKSVNFFSTDYPSECSSDKSDAWHRLRFWLLDTATIEGFDCYQSDNSTSDQSCQDMGFGGSAGNNQSNTPTTSPNSIVWPFATKNSNQYNRVDQGWDIQDKPGANIYAIAPGTLHVYQPDCAGGFGSDYPTEELDSDIGGPTKWVYYGHVHIIPSLNGKHVDAGQLIAHANVTDPQGCSKAPTGWLEIGFSRPGTDAPVASGTAASPEGQKMKDILLKAQPAPGGAP